MYKMGLMDGNGAGSWRLWAETERRIGYLHTENYIPKGMIGDQGKLAGVVKQKMENRLGIAHTPARTFRKKRN